MTLPHKWRKPTSPKKSFWVIDGNGKHKKFTASWNFDFLQVNVKMVLWPFTPHRYHTILIVLSPIPTPSPNPSPASAGALKHHLLRSVQHRLKSIFSSFFSLIFQINTPFLSHFDTVSCHPNKKNKVFSSTFSRKKYSFQGLFKHPWNLKLL